MTPLYVAKSFLFCTLFYKCASLRINLSPINYIIILIYLVSAKGDSERSDRQEKNVKFLL